MSFWGELKSFKCFATDFLLDFEEVRAKKEWNQLHSKALKIEGKAKKFHESVLISFPCFSEEKLIFILILATMKGWLRSYVIDLDFEQSRS